LLLNVFDPLASLVQDGIQDVGSPHVQLSEKLRASERTFASASVSLVIKHFAVEQMRV